MAVTIDRQYAEAFSRRSALMWLLLLNVAVFVALRLIAVAGMIGGNPSVGEGALAFVSLPHSPAQLFTSPLSPAVYMFAQYDPSHLMFNCLWLAWSGMVAWPVFGNRAMTYVYLAGGMGGALAFWAYNAFVPASSAALLGASAAVIAVAVAVTVVCPDKRMNMLFLPPVRLKWVTIAMLAVTVLLFSGHNAGSDAAHIGGAVAGLICGFILRNRSVSPAGVKAKDASAATAAISDREQLDMLLDKIRRSGYESLSPVERMILYNLSKKLKQ